MTRLQGKVEKGWGHEEIWISNDKYCSKFLYFKEGARFSMHFHKEKTETWRIMSGEFTLRLIETKTGTTVEQTIGPGFIVHIATLTPHQLICNKEGTVLEVSTPDSVEDNYRVFPGDSQNVSPPQNL